MKSFNGSEKKAGCYTKPRCRETPIFGRDEVDATILGVPPKKMTPRPQIKTLRSMSARGVRVP